MQRSAEIAVVGGGPSGLVAAIATASAGLNTVLFAPPVKPDRRTTALLDGSVRVLDALGVWPLLEGGAAPLAHLRIVDATQRLIRAREITFEASELGLDAFGQNVENEHLRNALRTRVDTVSGLRVVDEPVD